MVSIQRSSAFNETIVHKLVQDLAMRWYCLLLSVSLKVSRGKQDVALRTDWSCILVLDLNKAQRLSEPLCPFHRVVWGNLVRYFFENSLKTIHIICCTLLMDHRDSIALTKKRN